MNRFILLSGLIILVFLASLSLAGIPKLINYQGMLTGSDGKTPVPDENYNLTFKIYGSLAGTDSLWREYHPNVPVTNGLFNIILGSITTLNLAFDTDYWLGVKVGTDSELSPRIRLTSVAYAYRAQKADTANYAQAGGSGDNDWAVNTTDGILITGGAWGIARYGNTLYGNADSTHVNLGVACITGHSGFNYKYCTVGGGLQNTASADYATVAGGALNTANNFCGTVGGGGNNTASGSEATVGGGMLNTASGFESTVGGGGNDTSKAFYAGVFSGYSNLAGDGTGDTAAFVGGGYDNAATAKYTTVSGGKQNTATNEGATVGGGYNNTAGPGGATTVGGGMDNTAASNLATVGGGSGNTAGSALSTVGGGEDNSAMANYATVGGGVNNTASGEKSTVGGGNRNTASYPGATVAGGDSNSATQGGATVGGGYNNHATAWRSTVAGGAENNAVSDFSTIGGGYGNKAGKGTSWHASTVCGGWANINEGEYSVIPGGRSDTLTSGAPYSMAFGYGVYVADSSRIVFFDSTSPGRLGINRYDRDGGINYPIHVGTSTANGNGAYLSFDGQWHDASSKTFKTDFQPLDGEKILTEISNLPLESWRYKGTPGRHIGPYAEDFVQAFDVGTVREDGTHENKYLAPSDVAGVALLGVKELARQNQELKQIIEELRQRIAELEKTK
jgi:hypothetical protein